MPRRYLDVFTSHTNGDPGWEGQPRPLLRYRAQYDSPLGTANRLIGFVVESDQAGPVTLTWSLATDLELAQHFAVLRDLETGQTRDLWAHTSYAFDQQPGPRAFQIELTGGRTAPPIAHDQHVTTNEETAVPVTLTAQDPDGASLAFSLVTAPQHGTVLGNPPLLSYTPNVDYSGPDSFTFRASNGTAESNIATVSISVNPVNDAPVANPASVVADEDVPLALTLSATDVDGDALTFVVVTPPAHGTLSGSGPALTYTPAPDYFGPDGFTFRASDGLLSSGVASVGITVRPVNDPPLIDFTVPGPSRNVLVFDNNIASFAEGANVVAFSSQQAVGDGGLAFHAIDDAATTRWLTATGQVTNQFFVVELQNGPRRFDRVRLMNAGTTQSVKRFEVQVSTTTLADEAFQTVLADTAADLTRIQEFILGAPVEARFVKLLARDNYGSTTGIALKGFEVIDSSLAGIPAFFARPENAALLSEGAAVTSFSSQQTSFPATQAIDGSTTSRWTSASGQASGQHLVVQLARGAVHPVDRVRLLNDTTVQSGGARGVRDFRISVSATTSDEGAFTTVFTGTAANVAAPQEFVFPGGSVPARYVRLDALNTQGSTCCISVFELQVVPLPAGPNSVSSYFDHNNRPENMADNNNSTAWVTATGQVANQFVEWRLAGHEPLVDRVRLQGAASTDSLKDFEVLVSTTTDEDTAFTSVLNATLLNTSQLQEFLLPGGPVRAQYVRLLAKNNHGNTSTLRVTTFEVVSVGSEGNIVSLLGPPTDLARNESPAQIANGARVVRFSSAFPGDAPTAMLDYSTSTTGWRATSLGNQYAVIELGGGTSWTLDAVTVSGSGSQGEHVKRFQVWVSNTTDDDAAFSLALDREAALFVLQSFALPAGTLARYVKYVPLTNYGHPTMFMTNNFDVRAREASGVVAASSWNSISTRPEAALDGDTGTLWTTAAGASTNQWLKVALSGGESRSIYAVRIRPASGAGARDFEIRVSTTTADDGAFATVLTGTLVNQAVTQEFAFPLGVTQAKYVQFFWKNGYSSVIWTGELEVLAVPDASAGLLGFSSQVGDSVSARAALDLDRDTSWFTPSGQNANQWLKIVLPRAEPWLIDQVLLQPRVDCCDDASAREFEVQVSTTTAADSEFATVLGGALRNNRTLQSFSFPAVPARYVRLLLKNNHGGTQMGLGTFWVVSPQIGGPVARFLDRSRDPDGALAAYSWSFGDGGVSTARDPVHAFAGPGAYPVALTATDSGGTGATRTITYHVFGGPQADFTFSQPVNEGQAATFTDLSTDSVGGIALREWEWGDGTARTLNQNTPLHTYTDNGNYPVTLLVTNTRGVSASVTKSVPVANRPPTASAGPDKTVVWAQNWNDSSSASDPSSVDQASLVCDWDFGDGQTAHITSCNSSLVRVAHPYPVPGTYTARLTVTDKDGGVTTDTALITVNKRATALALCAPHMSTLADSEEIDVTAVLSDVSVIAGSMAGKTVRFTVDGTVTDVVTDASGAARLRLTVAADSLRNVTAAYIVDGLYLGSSASGTVRLARRSDAGRPDTLGTDFWLAFPENLGAPTLSLFVTGDAATTGTVQVPGLNVCVPFSVTANQVTTVPIPTTVQMSGQDAVEPKGIHVTALDDVTVYGLNRLQSTTDAYLGLPTDILGTEHIVLGYRNSNIVNASQLGVVATADDTRVTIRPPVQSGTHPAGVPFDVVLDRGQTYQLRTTANGPADITGTLINSDKPIAVFGGHQCANVPGGVTFCDHIVEQIPPSVTWGTSFVTMPLATRLNGDTFVFLASTDATTVRLNGGVVATLNRGQKHERIVAGPAQITSDKPILVAQYSNGTSYDGVTSDPFMMLIPPFEQFLSSYTLSTPASGFAINYVNVVAPASAVGAITLDGAPIAAGSFVPIGTTGFSGAQRSVTAGSHHLAGPAPFGAFIYGFANFDSYGYPGGMALTQVARVTSLSLAPESETSMIGVERCVTATVSDETSAPVAEVRVDFAVTGANPRTGFASTAANGQASFCYVGANTGNDSIVASVGTVSDTAAKQWVSNGPPVAHDASLTTNEDVPLTVTLTATDVDGDPLTFTLLSQPSRGALSGTPPNLTYTPAANYSGRTASRSRRTTATADSNVATVSITVNGGERHAGGGRARRVDDRSRTRHRRSR